MKITLTCKQCGSAFWRPPSKADRPYCSLPCYWQSKQKGDVIWGAYKWIVVDGARVAEHRHVAEQKIGRKLRSNEEVHHANENKLDNSPDNLEVLEKPDHRRKHTPTRWDVDAAVEMRLAGVPIISIAENFGVDPSHVRRVLIKRGAHKTGQARKIHRLKWDVEEAIRMRASGMSFEQISAKIGVSVSSVFYGVKKRS